MTVFSAREPRKVYIERLVLMATLVVISTCLQGLRVLVVCVLCVALCMAIDALCCKIRKIRYNFKAAEVPFWGLAAAMMMPASVEYWTIALSAIICIVVGKHIFGASENIMFSPPAISTAFLMICYPAQMLYFPKYGTHPPIIGVSDELPARSIEYSIKLGLAPTASITDILMGLVPASIGAAYILVIAVCGVCLAIRRSNSACAILAAIAMVGGLAFFFPRTDAGGWYSVFYEICSGYFLFGVVFLACEPYRMPQTPIGCALYGAFLGYITVMFRIFGQTEGSFLFALLITGAVTDAFDRMVDNLTYWKKTYLNSFEKNKIQAEKNKQAQKSVKLFKPSKSSKTAAAPNTERHRISDTQEIIIPDKYRFNELPVDGIIKRRHKSDGNTEDNPK